MPWLDSGGRLSCRGCQISVVGISRASAEYHSVMAGVPGRCLEPSRRFRNDLAPL